MPKPDLPQVDERERAVAALELRRSGLPYREIAARLDYADESGARHAVTRLLDRTEAEGVAELRAIYTERLEAITARYYPAALSGDVEAAGIVLRTHDRLARLWGANAPATATVAVTRVEDMVANLSTDEIVEMSRAALLAKMDRQSTEAVAR